VWWRLCVGRCCQGVTRGVEERKNEGGSERLKDWIGTRSSLKSACCRTTPGGQAGQDSRNVQRQGANVDADRYGDGCGLTAPMSFTYKDRCFPARINIFRRRYSNWAFLADHVRKDLFHWLTHRRRDDPLITRIEKTNPKMRNQRRSQRHQSDQIWPVICALTLNPETY
jgi:hypothetical protein